MTDPDYRALCAELVAAVDEASDAVDRTSDCVNAANHPELWAQCVDLIRRQDDLLSRARAALAQPEPTAPTDEEIEEWADASSEVPLEEMDPEVHGWRRCFTKEEFGASIRAALARWGTPANNTVGTH